jgi:hypothetical protein
MARLPNRTTGEDLKLLIESAGRGRTFDQIESLFQGSRTFQSTVQAAQQLGLVEKSDRDEIALTDIGKQFARGDNRARSEILLASMLDFEPYDLLLDWILGRENPDQTDIEDVETWWGTGDFGSSQTNIKEGSTAFAKFVEFAGLGEYKQGRKGYSSRIEWSDDAKQQVEEARGSESPKLQRREEDFQEKDEKEPSTSRGADQLFHQETPDAKSSTENNVLTLNLANDRAVHLSLPPKLTTAEKQRLIKLVELMANVDDDLDSDSGDKQMRMSF